MSLIKNSIQANVSSAVKQLTDKELHDLAEFLCYESVSDKDAKPNELQAKFITDVIGDGLWRDHLYDAFTKDSFFLKTSGSGREFIANVNRILLIECYFRFRALLVKPKEPSLKLSGQEKADLKLVLRHLVRENDDLIEDEASTNKYFEGNELVEVKAERKRLSKLYSKLLKWLK